MVRGRWQTHGAREKGEDGGGDWSPKEGREEGVKCGQFHRQAEGGENVGGRTCEEKGGDDYGKANDCNDNSNEEERRR